jgi:hypothetical protein
VRAAIGSPPANQSFASARIIGRNSGHSLTLGRPRLRPHCLLADSRTASAPCRLIARLISSSTLGPIRSSCLAKLDVAFEVDFWSVSFFSKTASLAAPMSKTGKRLGCALIGWPAYPYETMVKNSTRKINIRSLGSNGTKSYAKLRRRPVLRVQRMLSGARQWLLMTQNRHRDEVTPVSIEMLQYKMLEMMKRCRISAARV